MQIIRESQLRDGAATSAKRGLNVINDHGSALAAGDLVYVSGWTEGAIRRRKVKKADADAGVGVSAAYVVRAAADNGDLLKVYKTYRHTGQNTNGLTVGDKVYLSTTAGGWTSTVPTAAISIKQAVGRVAVVSASAGVVEFDLEAEQIESFGSDQIGTVIGGSTVANTTSAAVGALSAANVGVPVVLPLVIPDVASGNQDFTALPYKVRVVGVRYVKTGGAGNAGNSVTVHNGTTGNAITSVLNNASDTGTAVPSTIDDAFWDLAANATIRVVTVRAGGNNACVLFLDCIRIA